MHLAICRTFCLGLPIYDYIKCPKKVSRKCYFWPYKLLHGKDKLCMDVKPVYQSDAWIVSKEPGLWVRWGTCPKLSKQVKNLILTTLHKKLCFPFCQGASTRNLHNVLDVGKCHQIFSSKLAMKNVQNVQFLKNGLSVFFFCHIFCFCNQDLCLLKLLGNFHHFVWKLEV